MAFQTFIFIGRSGSGKGTQASLLMDHLHAHDPEHQIMYLETGARFREFFRGEGLSSHIANKIYATDARQPDFLAAWMWGSALIEELESDMHLVFDGAPRSKPEAELLTTAMGFYGREQPTVIYLNVSRRWSEDRLLARGREDDRTLAKIDKRLDWFDRDVLPAIEYFKTDPLYTVLDINGEQEVEKIQKDIRDKVAL